MPTKSQFILKFNYKNLLLTFWSFLSKCPKTRNNYHKMQTWLPEVTSTRVIYWLIGYPSIWYHANPSSLSSFNLHLSFPFALLNPFLMLSVICNHNNCTFFFPFWICNIGKKIAYHLKTWRVQVLQCFLQLKAILNEFPQVKSLCGHFDLLCVRVSAAHQFSPLLPAAPKSQTVSSPSPGEGTKFSPCQQN